MNIVTIFLGISVGATMQADKFLSWKPLFIFSLGLVDFCCLHHRRYPYRKNYESLSEGKN